MAAHLKLCVVLAAGALAGCSTPHRPATTPLAATLPASSAPAAPSPAAPAPAPVPVAAPDTSLPPTLETNAVQAESIAYATSQPAAPPEGTMVKDQPPPPQVEVVGKPPRPDCVWMPGFWSWDNGWVWTSGCWGLPPTKDSVWVSGHWAHRGKGWVWVKGYWRKG
ncbi:MAG: YXWGXW repeat-containing protein [Verrucomicrobiota bacterium]